MLKLLWIFIIDSNSIPYIFLLPIIVCAYF
jgi:hypothetical protein